MLVCPRGRGAKGDKESSLIHPERREVTSRALSYFFRSALPRRRMSAEFAILFAE